MVKLRGFQKVKEKECGITKWEHSRLKCYNNFMILQNTILIKKNLLKLNGVDEAKNSYSKKGKIKKIDGLKDL